MECVIGRRMVLAKEDGWNVTLTFRNWKYWRTFYLNVSTLAWCEWFRNVRVEFDCPIDGCVRSYETVAGLQKRLDVGNHVFRFHRESQFDHIKRQYANMVSEELPRPLFDMNSYSTSAPSTEQNRQHVGKVPIGWALKKQKSSSRFSHCLRAYVSYFLCSNACNKGNRKRLHAGNLLKVKTHLNDTDSQIGEDNRQQGITDASCAWNAPRKRRQRRPAWFVGTRIVSVHGSTSCRLPLSLRATKRKHGSLDIPVVRLEEVEEILNEERMEEKEEDISGKKKVVFDNLQLKHPITYKSYKS